MPNSNNSSNNGTTGRVINFTAAREAKIEEKRRRYERILFKHILGVYCVAEGKGLKAVELVDVSTDGLSFQLPVNSKNLDVLAPGQDVTFRFYFSQETFIPVSVRVQNERNCIEEGQKFIRFGCTVDTASQSYETYKLFVMFLSKYAESSQQDKGDLKFFFF
ncbi:MAG: PilZ domain-containing protein [Deltaproteobacteria bacterium]|nr:PilZ domain-containing protein [Deltaproteobacteria bacterium]